MLHKLTKAIHSLSRRREILTATAEALLHVAKVVEPSSALQGCFRRQVVALVMRCWISSFPKGEESWDHNGRSEENSHNHQG